MNEEVLRFEGIESHLFLPAADRPSPALIVLHERYGLVRHTLDLARKAAGDGFVGVAPDLFSRWPGDRAALARGAVRVLLPDPEIAGVVHRTIDELRAHPRVDRDRIVLMGVCQSGRYAVVVASERGDLAACVTLYGAAQDRDWEVDSHQPRALADLVRGVRAPFLFLFGESDHVISLANVVRLRDTFEAAGRSYRMRVFPGAPHGWLNDTMPGRYRPAAAAEAWRMILGFADEVFAGAWPTERVRSEYSADVAATYDFLKNVRLE